MNAVDISGLTKMFDGLRAVDGIDLAIEKGELFGLLGPNGAGKTTMISMLCTILRPTSGTATVWGHDIVKKQDDVRRSIGIVFQDPSLDDNLIDEPHGSRRCRRLAATWRAAELERRPVGALGVHLRLGGGWVDQSPPAELAVLAERLVAHHAIDEGEERVIFAQSHVAARVDPGPELTDQNIASADGLTAENLDSAVLRV